MGADSKVALHSTMEGMAEVEKQRRVYKLI
jgi:hypothetical protein